MKERTYKGNEPESHGERESQGKCSDRQERAEETTEEVYVNWRSGTGWSPQLETCKNI